MEATVSPLVEPPQRAAVLAALANQYQGDERYRMVRAPLEAVLRGGADLEVWFDCGLLRCFVFEDAHTLAAESRVVRRWVRLYHRLNDGFAAQLWLAVPCVSLDRVRSLVVAEGLDAHLCGWRQVGGTIELDWR
jgi:hypothetical protein